MKSSIWGKLRKGMVSTLALAITLTSVSVVNADTKSEDSYLTKNRQKAFEKMEDTAKHSVDLTGQDLENMKSLFNKDLLNNKLDIQVSNDNLDFENIKSLEINNESGTFKAVSVPIVGDKYSMFSALTVVYDSYNNISTYSESLITKSADNKFEITSYLEGEEISKQKTDLEYVSNEKLKEGLENIKDVSKDIEAYGGQSRGLGTVAACIAGVAGIDSIVAYLIAGTCVASCPAVPPICAACIAGVCTLGSASIAGVIACFNLK